MTAAAARLLLLGTWLLGLLVPRAFADDPAIRLPPTRPAPLATTLINGVAYVDTADIATRLGLKSSWTEASRKLTLLSPSGRIDLTADGRDSAVNGLRVFLGDPAVWHDGEFYVSKIDYERRLVPMLRPALAASIPPVPKVIALDPGHGLPDNGFENETLGLKERILTLDVARRLKKLLETEGYKVVLTRNDDNALSPEKKLDFPLRDEVANRAKADFFVSIHFNSLYPDTKTSGTEVYTFAPRTQHAADWWGGLRREDSDLMTEDVPVNRYDFWSVVLAQAVHRSVVTGLKTGDRGEKIKHLGVLRNLDCPGVLVESVFLSNDSEARLVATAEFRQKIAEAIAGGIRSYAATIASLHSPATLPTAAASGPTTSK